MEATAEPEIPPALFRGEHWMLLARDLGPEMAASLRLTALASLSSLVERVEQACARAALRDVVRMAESLAGTASLSGLPALEMAARNLERQAQARGELDLRLAEMRVMAFRSMAALDAADPVSWTSTAA